MDDIVVKLEEICSSKAYKIIHDSPFFTCPDMVNSLLIITKHVSVYESMKKKKITFAAQVTFKNIGQSDTTEAYYKLCTINCIGYDLFFSRNIDFHNKKAQSVPCHHHLTKTSLVVDFNINNTTIQCYYLIIHNSPLRYLNHYCYYNHCYCHY